MHNSPVFFSYQNFKPVGFIEITSFFCLSSTSRYIRVSYQKSSGFLSGSGIRVPYRMAFSCICKGTYRPGSYMCFAALSVIFKERAERPIFSLPRKRLIVAWLRFTVTAARTPLCSKALPARKIRNAPAASNTKSVGLMRGDSNAASSSRKNFLQYHKSATILEPE